MDATVMAQRVVAAVVERKALDVIVIDVRERSSYTDYLVVASGTSDRHVQSVAEHADTALGQQGVTCLGREGLREGQWALIDFGSVVLHVFHQFTRSVFDLEAMWRDAPCRRIASGSADLEAAPQAAAWALHL